MGELKVGEAGKAVGVEMSGQSYWLLYKSSPMSDARCAGRIGVPLPNTDRLMATPRDASGLEALRGVPREFSV